jgi:tetratricopeptide (TPR) repeat protein
LNKPADDDRAALENNVGMLYRATGRQDKALEHARRALDIATSVDGMPPSVVGLIHVNLALLEVQAGSADRAKKLFDRGMEIAEGISPDQPIMADILGTAAAYLRAAGRKSEAKRFAKRADVVRNGISQNTSIGKTVEYESLRLRGQ